MKRATRLVALLAAFFMMSEAAAQDLCVELAPKEWTATVAVATGGWLSGSFFEEGGCSWNGAEGLNGFDAYVLDVSEYAGLPISIETTASAGPVKPFISGIFLSEGCERAGFFGTSDRGVPATASVPPDAKWMVVYPDAGGVGQVSFKISSPGRTCAEPKPVKKHGKKKKKPRRPR